ncbi:unknown [Bacteroides sp. CAG:462]|nr:unknown [Bacteroides sp. CAG:462]
MMRIRTGTDRQSICVIRFPCLADAPSVCQLNTFINQQKPNRDYGNKVSQPFRV